MAATHDPNVPDCSNGDYFCRICLASMNSEQMWSSHIVGKRHIKNALTYTKELPKRKFSDDEDSYDRSSKFDRYEKYNDYPPSSSRHDSYYDYYKRRHRDYSPEVRPNVVIDYGHKQSIDDILQQETKKSRMVPQKEKVGNIDDTRHTFSRTEARKNNFKEPDKDDFFEKINKRELAKDKAAEIAKKRVYQEKVNRESPGTSQRKHEKQGKGSTASDIIDILHKYNGDKLFKEHAIKKYLGSSSSKNSEAKPAVKLDYFDPGNPTTVGIEKLLDSYLKPKIDGSSSSKNSEAKSAVKPGNIDPENPSTDVLEKLLNSYLKPKIDSMLKETATKLEKEPKKDVNLDDPKVLYEKLETLPTMTFFELMHKRLVKMELRNSEEVGMLLKIILEAQQIACKKLPPHLQAVLKAKMSGNDFNPTEASVKSTTVSQNPIVASIPGPIPNRNVSQKYPAPSTSQIQNTAVSQNSTVPATSQINNTIISQNVTHPSTVPSHPRPPAPPPPPPIQKTVVRTFPIASVPPPLPRAANPLPVRGIPNFNALLHPAQAVQARIPVPTVASSSTAVQPSTLQNSMTGYNYYPLPSMNQNRPVVPSTNVNSVPSTQPSQQLNQQPPRVSPYYNMQQALQQLQVLAAEYAKKKRPVEESNKRPEEESRKRPAEESRKRQKEESNKRPEEESRKRPKDESKREHKKR